MKMKIKDRYDYYSNLNLNKLLHSFSNTIPHEKSYVNEILFWDDCKDAALVPIQKLFFFYGFL